MDEMLHDITQYIILLDVRVPPKITMQQISNFNRFFMETQKYQ